MIRLIVQVGETSYRDGDRLNLNYRVFEFENAMFESLLKGESPQLHVVGVEVFDPPKVTAPPPVQQASLPLAVVVNPPPDPAALKARLAAKRPRWRAWLNGSETKPPIEPVKLPG